MPKLVARLGRRSTIVGLPPSAVPNFAKSLIVVARRGFSDAARRSIVSLSEPSFFARASLGCDVSRGRERDVRDESASVCLGGAGRQWYRGRPFGDRRSARGCSAVVPERRVPILPTRQCRGKSLYKTQPACIQVRETVYRRCGA